MPYSASHTTNRFARRPLIAIGFAGLSLLALAAATVAVSQAAPDCAPRFNSSGALTCGGDGDVPSTAPVDLSEAIDLTAVRGDTTLIASYAKRATQLADATIDHGGTITVRTFSRSAPHGSVIFKREIPSLQEQRLAVRGPVERAARADLESAVDRALARGATREYGEGSDVANALARLGDVERTAGAPLVGVLLTDGRNFTRQLDLVSEVQVDAAKATQRLRQTIGRPTSVDTVLIAGIGATGGRMAHEDNALTTALTEAYRAVCPAVSDHCVVTPSL